MTHQRDANLVEEVIFSYNSAWLPEVIRRDNSLYLRFGAGADANHEPRTFFVPISERHLDVIKADFSRYLLLWSALLPLCDDAGTQDILNQEAAASLVNSVLLDSKDGIEALFAAIRWYDAPLIARHVDIELLEKGDLFAALRSATVEADQALAEEHFAARNRARRGVHLSPLDTALLRYTNQYLHGGTLPSRLPDAVDSHLLPQVIEVITVAEQACADMELRPGWGKGDYNPNDKRQWQNLQATVESALRNHYPTLTKEAISSVSFLMCSEAASRARMGSS